MTSSASAEPTQELSQSHFDGILRRSRTTREGQHATGRQEEDEEGDETQHTLNEGDEGHIDLVSSLPSRQDADESLGSEPVDFSPTQSQQRLPPFPESQRFKTPATVGKKRSYDGEMVDSPELPRNPLLRDGMPTPGLAIGLSQVFAGTQAGSSPFLGIGPAGPQSDRPSPNIELQTRPVTAMTSSPLRPISDFQRATTEPVSKYVPMKQSQTERQRQARRKQLLAVENQGDEDEGSDDDDPDFKEPSLVVQQRRKRERDERVKRNLEMLSSTRRSLREMSMSKSSPQVSSSGGAGGLLGDAGSVADHEINGTHESEEETEQEDEEVVIAVRRSSQVRRLDDEDKENDALQIPETAARLQMVLNGELPMVDASPSLGHGRSSALTSGRNLGHSSEPFAVADSQPSHSKKNQVNSIRARPITTSQDTDFVPQSPTASPTRTLVASHSRSRSPSILEDAEGINSDLPLGGMTAHSQGGLPKPGHTRISVFHPSGESLNSSPQPLHSHQPLGKGIPEASGDVETSRPAEKMPSTTRNAASTGLSEFETGQSRVSMANNAQVPVADSSSPPIVTAPPGRKRKRMAEIADEPSPPKASLSFSATEALGLDPDFHNITETPKLLECNSRKKARLEYSSSPAIPPGRATQANLVPASNHENGEMAINADGDVDVDGDASGWTDQSPRPRLSVRAMGRALRSSALTPSSALRPPHRSSDARGSTWDLGASPPQQSVPTVRRRPLLRTASPRKRTDILVKSALTQPENQQTTTKSMDATRSEASKRVPAQNDSPTPMAFSEPVMSEQSTSVPPGDVSCPNMVFACFNGKTRAYYPARCLGISATDPRRLQIQWDGYEPDEVDALGVRSLDLRVGDIVKVDHEGFPKVSCVIRGFKHKITNLDRDQSVTDIRGHKSLILAPKQRQSLPAGVSTDAVKEVPVSAIYLDSNMWRQMKDRTYEYHPLVIRPDPLTGYLTPMERPSTPSTPSSRSRRAAGGTGQSALTVPTSTGLLANMAFAISYDDAARKNTLAELIQSNGGFVLQGSFHDLLEPDSMDLRPQYRHVGFTALLTERHSRKEKYMQALALDLPCLSGRWIEACTTADQVVDWQMYLLPAGESIELDGATRSRVMRAMDPTSVKLSQMISSRPTVLSGANVAVVMGRGKAEMKRKPYPFLIQALGARRVEKVADVKAAEELVSGDEPFDWVIVDDRDMPAAEKLLSAEGRKGRDDDGDDDDGGHPGRPGCRVAGNELIVQSLILGKLWHGSTLDESSKR